MPCGDWRLIVSIDDFQYQMRYEEKEGARLRSLLRILVAFVIATACVQLRLVHELGKSNFSNTEDYFFVAPSYKQATSRRASSLRSPACNPHWNLALPSDKIVTPSDIHILNGHPHPLVHLSWNSTLPFTRIYFYHIRKAGGTMIRKYLQKVAANYNIDLTIQENKFASEEVGSVPGTFYITNLRDPVERSISHFKYEGRWDCKQLVKNHSFVPTKSNARKFEDWKETNGFVPSDCDEPFSFTECAVNCYLQSFSGEGCSSDQWESEFRLAKERLFRYNLIFIYEKFKDSRYIQAIEDFFGVSEFNKASDMWCGWQAHDANEKIPFITGFEHVLKLTRLNTMDTRLYKESTSCSESEYHSFGLNKPRFASHENRILEGVR